MRVFVCVCVCVCVTESLLLYPAGFLILILKEVVCYKRNDGRRIGDIT